MDISIFYLISIYFILIPASKPSLIATKAVLVFCAPPITITLLLISFSLSTNVLLGLYPKPSTTVSAGIVTNSLPSSTTTPSSTISKTLVLVLISTLYFSKDIL